MEKKPVRLVKTKSFTVEIMINNWRLIGTVEAPQLEVGGLLDNLLSSTAVFNIFSLFKAMTERLDVAERELKRVRGEQTKTCEMYNPVDACDR